MIKKVSEDIWKISFDSNIYILSDCLTAIDAGDHFYHDKIRKAVDEIISPLKIKQVIFTHLHHDHIGNFDLFPNAKFFASKDEIEMLKKNRHGTILDEEIEKKFDAELYDIKKAYLPGNYEVIYAPGHTLGSICIFEKKEKILFSGDTLFLDGNGRTDLPTSDDHAMEKTLQKLKKIDYMKLCPGHDY